MNFCGTSAGPKIFRIRAGHTIRPRGAPACSAGCRRGSGSPARRRRDIDPGRRVVVARGEDERLDAALRASRQRHGDRGTPGVSEDDCRRRVELEEGLVDQVGLRFRRPDRAARAPAVPVSRPVEDDDAILLGGLFEQAARTRNPESCCRCRAAGRAARPCHARHSAIGHHRSRGTVPRWIETLGGLRHPSVHQGRDSESRYANSRRGRVRVIAEVRQLLACARPRRHETVLRVQYFHAPAPLGSRLNSMLRDAAMQYPPPTCEAIDGSFGEELCQMAR